MSEIKILDAVDDAVVDSAGRPVVDSAVEDSEVESLIEDVSIDGMCGVY